MIKVVCYVVETTGFKNTSGILYMGWLVGAGGFTVDGHEQPISAFSS